jgi:hypothetical protein
MDDTQSPVQTRPASGLNPIIVVGFTECFPKESQGQDHRAGAMGACQLASVSTKLKYLIVLKYLPIRKTVSQKHVFHVP